MKRFLKKLSVVAVALFMTCALCLGIFVGCGGKGDITVYIFCSASDADTNQQLIDAWAEAYYAENQAELEALGVNDISVGFEYDTDTNNYFNNLQLRLSAGSAQDIIYVSPKYIKSYAAADTVLDLTNYVNWDKYPAADVWQGALSSYAYNPKTKIAGNAITYDKEAKNFKDGADEVNGVYALPKDYSSFGLMYNKMFFTEELTKYYTDTKTTDGSAYFVKDDGTTGEAAPYIAIGRTVRYFPYNFYNYDNFKAALDAKDPIAVQADKNGGYDVTITGWPGETYKTGVADDPNTGYDESIGYVTYTYNEYSAMTFAVCLAAQKDRASDGKHQRMEWLNDTAAYNGVNYVYGNDQYEGSLYLTAWLLGNDADVINDTYTSTDAGYDYVLNEAGTKYEKVETGAKVVQTVGSGADAVNIYESDYGINSEAYIEAYAAFLAYGSDWNNLSYFSGNKGEGVTTRGGWACVTSGRLVFYGIGTWDLQSMNATAIDKLSVGIMPEPVSEDFAVYSRVKDYNYQQKVYGEKTDIKTTAMIDEERYAAQADRQDQWFARMDTVGFGVNADVLERYGQANKDGVKEDEWKIAAAADLCAWLTMGEDIQTALTYAGSQVTSLISQNNDYVNYNTTAGEDGAFAKMITPEGNRENKLTVTAEEVELANSYLSTLTTQEGISYTLSGTELTGEDIWHFAVAAANLMYNDYSRKRAGDWVEDNFPSLVPYLNPYFSELRTKEFAGANFGYKVLNMVSLDRASRNLQAKMPAVNGAADSGTFTYATSWYDTFGTPKGNALIAYEATRAPGGASRIKYEAQNFSVGDLATIEIGGADGNGWVGNFYTPLSYCASVVASVQQTLLTSSLEAELNFLGGLEAPATPAE